MRLRKPWDEAMVPELRLRIWGRRREPDGEERKVTTYRRGERRVNHYPFAKMLNGDYFIVPITGSKNSMITAFRQGAARNDIEISIQLWKVKKDDTPAFRVIKVLEGVKALKAKAAKIRGMEIPASDGRWLDRRKGYRRRDAVPRDTPSVRPSAPSRPSVAVEATPTAPPGYDRSAALLAAQARARAELGLEDDEVDDRA